MSTVHLKCDTCKREIETLERTSSLNSFNKCIITKGCRGRLYKIGRNPYNVREYLEEPTVRDIENFTPRKSFFSFSQDLANKKWNVRHGMGVFPAVTVYDINGNEVPSSDYSINLINANMIELVFTTEVTGTVHCVARSSRDLKSSVPPSTEGLFKVTNKNVLTLAVLGKMTKNSNGTGESIFTCSPDAKIRINIQITEPEKEPIFCSEDISTHLQRQSSWIDWTALKSRKRRNYCIKSVNLNDFTSIQEFYNDVDSIPDGTRFNILGFDYGEGFVPLTVKSRNLFVLLSSPPFSRNDKLLDTIIDVGEVSASRDVDSFVIIGGELYIDTKKLEKIYPILQKADPLSPVQPLNALTVVVENITATGFSLFTDPDYPESNATVQVMSSDYTIAGGSGNYSYIWSTNAGFTITNSTSASPVFSNIGSNSVIEMTGQLFVIDNVTGQNGIAPFVFTAIHQAEDPIYCAPISCPPDEYCAPISCPPSEYCAPVSCPPEPTTTTTTTPEPTTTTTTTPEPTTTTTTTPEPTTTTTTTPEPTTTTTTTPEPTTTTTTTPEPTTTTTTTPEPTTTTTTTPEPAIWLVDDEIVQTQTTLPTGTLGECEIIHCSPCSAGLGQCYDVVETGGGTQYNIRNVLCVSGGTCDPVPSPPPPPPTTPPPTTSDSTPIGIEP